MKCNLQNRQLNKSVTLRVNDLGIGPGSFYLVLIDITHYYTY